MKNGQISKTCHFLTKFALPLCLIILSMLNSRYISHFLWKETLAHLAKPKNLILSKPSFFALNFFLKKTVEEPLILSLIHHSPTSLELLQTSNHDCRARNGTVTLKLHPWQLCVWANSCYLGFKSCFYSSIPTFMRICFSFPRSNNHCFISVLQTR